MIDNFFLREWTKISLQQKKIKFFFGPMANIITQISDPNVILETIITVFFFCV